MNPTPKSFRTQVALRPCRTPQRPCAETTSFARRLPLRPTRIVFLHEAESRDGRHPVEGQPWSGVRRWRGVVETPPTDGWVAVVLSEIPSGRTATTNLEESLFEDLNIFEGTPFELVRWVDLNGQEHLKIDRFEAEDVS